MSAENIIQLFQKTTFFPARHFSLLRGRELEISQSLGRKKQVYKVDLLALRSPSEKIVHIAWKWWLGSLGCLLVTILLVMLFSTLKMQVIGLTIGAIGFLAGAILSLVAWKKGDRKMVFYSTHSNYPLVSLYLGSPNKKACQQFVDTIETRIDELKQEYNLSKDQELAGELRTLRRLNESGVISMEDYESSKEIIFQKH